MSIKIKQEGVGKSMVLLRRAAIFLFILTMVVALVIFFCGDFLVSLVGKDFSEIKPLMNWMYPVLIFGCMNFLLGFVGLVNLNQQKYFFFAVFISGTISLGLLFWLARYWGIQVAAMTMSLSEVLLFLACLSRLLYLNRKNK